MSKPLKQTIAIHTLPNISSCKDNQTMKINSINRIQHEKKILLKNCTHNLVEKTFSRLFRKKSKLNISPDQ